MMLSHTSSTRTCISRYVSRRAAALSLATTTGRGGGRRGSLAVAAARSLSTAPTSNDATATTDWHSFSYKKALVGRLGKLEETAAATLQGFYEPSLQSFSVRPGQHDSGDGKKKTLSLTSTCFALQAIRAGNDGTYDSIINTTDVDKPACSATSSSASESTMISAHTVLSALLHSNWRNDDLFQISLVVSTVLQFLPDQPLDFLKHEDAVTSDHLERLIDAVLQSRPRRRNGNLQDYSDYILYYLTQAYACLYDQQHKQQLQLGDEEGGGGGGLLQGDAPNDTLTLALARCAEVSYNELCRQLAFRYANDTSSFDVMQLAYSLQTYLTANRALRGSDGLRRLAVSSLEQDGPIMRSAVGPVNQKLVREALRLFFAEQLDNGMWEKGQPIYKELSKPERNVGNAFVFALDTLASLMKNLPPEEFRPYLGQLEKTLDWIEQHQTVDVVADGGMRPLRGWASPHLHPDKSPQAWSTAQTLACVSRMRHQIRSLMHNDVLEEFGGVSFSKEGPNEKHWQRLLDSDLGGKTMKDVLEERMLTPFQSSVRNPGVGAAYSAILFGPPGTAKTTICESLARKMGWDFVVIDTSVFLADGLSNVTSRIKYVFERLQSLDRSIILFDEIEEFCLDREGDKIGMESRMLTTAMLTAINDLRRARRSIFFLATNRLRAFDSAIIRPGRFDMQLFVGTPNLQSRVVQLEQKLAALPLEEATRNRVVGSYRDFLASVWEDDAMFMNFLEGQHFAAACANAAASNGGDLTVETMQSLLDSQTAVMTVRGTTRDEFVASMGLSRL